ncbi:MAG: ATP-binding protein [Anaerolineae bacterium]|jgi:hypothetical protein|nr:ATP-binding protein [Anaerolineae bacterium]
MLIRFTVENFMSFRDEVEFSMIPGKAHKQHPGQVIKSDKRGDLSALKAGLIYGANASGKSNLIKAIEFAKNLITHGLRPKQRIPITPFRFERDEKRPSRFQFEFKHKDRAYAYGFLLNTEQILEEWLYEITSSTEKPLFERVTNPDHETTVTFSNLKYTDRKDKEFLEFTARGTRPNQLFLTESLERNIPYFEAVVEWFDDYLVILFPHTKPIGFEFNIMNDEQFKSDVTTIVQAFDTGISSIQLQKSEFDEDDSLPEELKTMIREMVIPDLMESENQNTVVFSPFGSIFFLIKEGDKFFTLRLLMGHRCIDSDEEGFLELREESDGTQRLFELIPAMLALLKTDRVFIVDELDRSLHPQLSYSLLELFLNHPTPTRSQLIATTHEEHLLDLDLLRRDEIWFVEKEANGVSKLFSLEEYAPRYDKDIRKGYLLGRFGGIPLIKEVEGLYVEETL